MEESTRPEDWHRKGSETFHDAAQEGDIMCEAKNPVMMRLEGWGGARHERLSQSG